MLVNSNKARMKTRLKEIVSAYGKSDKTQLVLYKPGVIQPSSKGPLAGG